MHNALVLKKNNRHHLDKLLLEIILIIFLFSTNAYVPNYTTYIYFTKQKNAYRLISELANVLPVLKITFSQMRSGK